MLWLHLPRAKQWIHMEQKPWKDAELSLLLLCTGACTPEQGRHMPWLAWLLLTWPQPVPVLTPCMTSQCSEPVWPPGEQMGLTWLHLGQQL